MSIISFTCITKRDILQMRYLSSRTDSILLCGCACLSSVSVTGLHWRSLWALLKDRNTWDKRCFWKKLAFCTFHFVMLWIGKRLRMTSSWKIVGWPSRNLAFQKRPQAATRRSTRSKTSLLDASNNSPLNTESLGEQDLAGLAAVRSIIKTCGGRVDPKTQENIGKCLFPSNDWNDFLDGIEHLCCFKVKKKS